MKISNKVWFIVICIFFIISLISAVWLYYQSQEMSKQFKNARKGWILQRQEFIGSLKQAKENLKILKGELSGLKGTLKKAHKQMVSYKKQYEDLSLENKKQDEKLINLQKKIEDKEKIIARLQTENKIYNQRFKQFKVKDKSSDFSKEEKEVNEFSSKLSKWKDEKDILKEKLILLKKKLNVSDIDKNDLIREINETNLLLERRIAKIDNFAKQLETLMKKSKEIAMNKAFDSVSTVELPPIIVRGKDDESGLDKNVKKKNHEEKKEAKIDKTLDSGKILFANQADNFVIINLGKRHGISKNMMFKVFRADKRIGIVKIVEVRNKLSGANIEKVTYGEIITANDSVKLMQY